MTTIPWRTGVNLREFAYYGQPCLQYTDLALQDRQLQTLQEMRVQLIRFYACRSEFTLDQTIPLLQTALDKTAQAGMQAIVCLEDSIGSGYNIPGTDQYRIPVNGVSHLHKRFWNDKLYRQFYIPHITPIVEAFSDHPAVAIWELGNEFALHPRVPEPTIEDAQAFLSFVSEASQAIKQIASTQLVSTGLITARHVTCLTANVEAQACELYRLPTIDVISVHFYADDSEEQHAIEIDEQADKAIDKPFYVGEVGAPWNGPVHRPTYYHERMHNWKTRGAFTVMPWAFDVSPTDVGVADTKAFARRFSDFEAIKDVVMSFGEIVDRIRPAEPLPPGSQPGAVEKKTFIVVWEEGMNVRDAPSRHATIIGELAYQDRIQVDVGSQYDDDPDGLIWWHHDDGVALDGSGRVSGWTAEQWPAKGHRYLELVVQPGEHPEAIKQFQGDENDPFDVNDILEVPWRDEMFSCLPVETIDWVQHFGNTVFAYGTQGLYAYSQELHGGIDLADTAAQQNELVSVKAGVFKGKVIGPSASFGPRNVRIRVDTEYPDRYYTIIYGHMHPEAPLVAEGTEINADTLLGYIATRNDLDSYESPADSGKYPLKDMSPHLHLEIRLSCSGSDYILNPLLFIPDAFRDNLAMKNADFYPWHKWQNPFDQPVLRLGGDVIGPKADPG